MLIFIRSPRLPRIHPTPKNVKGFGEMSLWKEMIGNVKYSFEIHKLEIAESLEMLFTCYLIVAMLAVYL